MVPVCLRNFIFYTKHLYFVVSVDCIRKPCLSTKWDRTSMRNDRTNFDGRSNSGTIRSQTWTEPRSWRTEISPGRNTKLGFSLVYRDIKLQGTGMAIFNRGLHNLLYSYLWYLKTLILLCACVDIKILSVEPGYLSSLRCIYIYIYQSIGCQISVSLHILPVISQFIWYFYLYFIFFLTPLN